VDRHVAAVPRRLLRLLAQALFTSAAEVGRAPLNMRLMAVSRLPQAVDRAQRVTHVTPHRDVERKRVAEHRGIVADSDNGASLGEPQIDGIAPRVLAEAHAADDVVLRFRHVLDLADVVGVVHREARVVEDPGGHGQREPLGEREDLLARTGHADVLPAHQERLLGVDERVPDRVDHAGLGQQAHVRRVRRLDDGLDVVALQRLARVRDVHRARRKRERLLESPSRHRGDAARVPHLPAALGDVLHGAHLREAAAGAERVVVAERAGIAHRRRHHHRRAVEVRVLELARALARSRGEMHVDERGLARGLGVAIRRREHKRLGQEQDRLHAGDG
jgi:hypothetical protein